MENILKAINEIAENKYSELKNQCSTYGELKEKIRKLHRDNAWESRCTTELQINRIICNKINALFDDEIGNTSIREYEKSALPINVQCTKINTLINKKTLLKKVTNFRRCKAIHDKDLKDQ